MWEYLLTREEKNLPILNESTSMIPISLIFDSLLKLSILYATSSNFNKLKLLSGSGSAWLGINLIVSLYISIIAFDSVWSTYKTLILFDCILKFGLCLYMYPSLSGINMPVLTKTDSIIESVVSLS